MIHCATFGAKGIATRSDRTLRTERSHIYVAAVLEVETSLQSLDF